MNNIIKRIQNLPEYPSSLEESWNKLHSTFNKKIIVLDDDPTGVQTVHDVPVFTDWCEETIENVFLEERQLVFILTNSRSFSTVKTFHEHKKIARIIANKSKHLNIPFILISRGDSTLRGHYPLETETLKNTIENQGLIKYDGEIILPFFKEGGRLTVDDIHYIYQNQSYTPVGESEFAKDRMFGFKNSDLKEWVFEKVEKTKLMNPVISVSLDELRKIDTEQIFNKLMNLKDFQKLIVNAVTEEDIKVFSIALIKAISKGKNYLYRTAASFTKIIGGIHDKPYLTRDELINPTNCNGGLIIIGSHVQKSTNQLNELKKLDNICFVEFDCHLIRDRKLFIKEIRRVQDIINYEISTGTTVCVYTNRKRIDIGIEDREEELALSAKISESITNFVSNCKPNPLYVLAKGGITSSDIGTKGLKIKKAEVAGQIIAGVPVWKTGAESKFPYIPYIIFPGNVGDKTDLRKIIHILEC